MNFKKLLPAAALLLCCSMTLGGCSASLKTIRSAAKFGSVLKEQPVTSATAEISCTVTTDAQGIPGDSRLRAVFRTQMDWQARRIFSDAELDLNLPESPIRQSMQVYFSADNENAAPYVHLDQKDLWLRLTPQNGELHLDTDLIKSLLENASGSAELESGENPVSGAHHSVLKATFPAQDLISLLESTGLSIPDAMQNCSWSGVSVPVEAEFEDKTFLPIRIQLTVQGMTPQILQAILSLTGTSFEMINENTEVGNLNILITNFSYEDPDVPMLPIGAAENALDLQVLRQLQED